MPIRGLSGAVIISNKGAMCMRQVRLMVMSMLAFGLSNGVAAAETTYSASVKWNAEVVKKTDVDLNVFANSDALSFTWNPSQGLFTTPTSGLTIQMGSQIDTSQYKLTAQLGGRTLSHVAGPKKGNVKVAAILGGIAIADEKPVDILRGNKNGVEMAADGMGHMDISKKGPHETPKGSYHEARNVDLRFHIAEGMNDLGQVVSGEKLADLPDGVFNGTVEMIFNASWNDVTA
ncbi:hypothetical protein [Chromobacterium haemolyticum]|uniref:hypothetical protein n=1 Tax=Chromobacterium TaxID=535 RepID=UPI0040577B11